VDKISPQFEEQAKQYAVNAITKLQQNFKCDALYLNKTLAEKFWILNKGYKFDNNTNVIVNVTLKEG